MIGPSARRAARPSRSVHSCTRPRASRSSRRAASVMAPSSPGPAAPRQTISGRRPHRLDPRPRSAARLGAMVDVQAPSRRTAPTATRPRAAWAFDLGPILAIGRRRSPWSFLGLDLLRGPDEGQPRPARGPGLRRAHPTSGARRCATTSPSCPTPATSTARRRARRRARRGQRDAWPTSSTTSRPTRPPPATPATPCEGWIADWRIYLADREDFADRAAHRPQRPAAARPRTRARRLGRQDHPGLRQVNDIPDCATPGDVG